MRLWNTSRIAETSNERTTSASDENELRRYFGGNAQGLVVLGVQTPQKIKPQSKANVDDYFSILCWSSLDPRKYSPADSAKYSIRFM